MAYRDKKDTIVILLDITELEIVGAFDRGVPNRERVLLRATEAVNLGRYALLIGLQADAGLAIPMRDSFFWFGDVDLTEGDMVYVYTGPGKPTVSSGADAGQKIYSGHWGRKSTVFQNKELVPLVIRLDGVAVDTFKPSLPSTGLSDDDAAAVSRFLKLINE